MKTHCDECGSSDGKEIYQDGGHHCFVCSDNSPKGIKPIIESEFTELVSINSIKDYKSFPLTSRGISQRVVDYYNVKMSVDINGKPESHFYPYTKKGQTVAYKERLLPKTFRTHGDFKGTELFGQSVSDGDRTLVITEGEIDCLSVAQAFDDYKGRIFPVVSLPSASGINAVVTSLDWVNRFAKVVLMLDQDEAGQEATEKLAKVIKPGKVFIAKLPEKDPNETLLKHGYNAILRALWDSQPWSPAGIVVGEDVWSQLLDRQATTSIPYPDCLEGLNQKLKGIRHGEITLFTSGTGSGKSTVIKEIILEILETTNEKVGLISLEESIGDTAEKFISMALSRSAADPPPLSTDEMRAGYEKVFADERLVLLDHQGSVGDSSLIDKIEHMAALGCTYLVLDHITIAVSEGTQGLTGNEAIDKMMSDLLKIVKRHNIWLGLISHLRKATSGGASFEEGKLASIDDIKGSGSIKQISFDIISFARNLVAEDERERNTIHFRVLKSRFTGLTGDAGRASYDPKTTRLHATGGFDFEANPI